MLYTFQFYGHPSPGDSGIVTTSSIASTPDDNDESTGNIELVNYTPVNDINTNNNYITTNFNFVDINQHNYNANPNNLNNPDQRNVNHSNNNSNNSNNSNDNDDAIAQIDVSTSALTTSSSLPFTTGSSIPVTETELVVIEEALVLPSQASSSFLQSQPKARSTSNHQVNSESGKSSSNTKIIFNQSNNFTTAKNNANSNNKSSAGDNKTKHDNTTNKINNAKVRVEPPLSPGTSSPSSEFTSSSELEVSSLPIWSDKVKSSSTCSQQLVDKARQFAEMVQPRQTVVLKVERPDDKFPKSQQDRMQLVQERRDVIKQAKAKGGGSEESPRCPMTENEEGK